ncbi:MAG TPA: hypothetical protein VGG25_20915 [Streptosporangiaceae bacterium]
MSQAAIGPDAAPTGDGYGAPTIQAAYDLPSSTAGSGETVAVVDAYNDPDAASDLATYRSDWSLPACGSGCFSVVNENGATSPLPTNAGTNGWDVEESLDVDMVSSVCPLCHIILVEASSASNADLGTAGQLRCQPRRRFRVEQLRRHRVVLGQRLRHQLLQALRCRDRGLRW